MPSTEAVFDDPSVSTVRALEPICDRFEAAWQSNARPAIEDYVG